MFFALLFCSDHVIYRMELYFVISALKSLLQHAAQGSEIGCRQGVPADKEGNPEIMPYGEI